MVRRNLKHKKRHQNTYDPATCEVNWLAIFKDVQAKTTTISKCEKEFNIPETTLRRRYKQWLAAGAPEEKNAPGLCDQRFNSRWNCILTGAQEAQLKKRILRKRAAGKRVDKKVIAREARALFPNKKGRLTARWGASFALRMKLRKRLGTRKKKAFGRLEWTNNITVFKEECRDQQTVHQIPASLVWNSDETRFQFGTQKMTTLDVQGSKAVYLKSAENDKRGVTVLASIAANGEKLPLAFVFKGRKGPRNLNIPAPHHMYASDSGWMTKYIWNLHISKMLAYARGDKENHVQLVYDSYKVHNNDDFLHKMDRSNVHLLVIPGGMTSVLQPFDRSIAGPWKEKVKNLVSDFYCDHDEKMTWQTLCEIIIKTWEELSSALVEMSFRKTRVFADGKYKEDIPKVPPVLAEEDDPELLPSAEDTRSQQLNVIADILGEDTQDLADTLHPQPTEPAPANIFEEMMRASKRAATIAGKSTTKKNKRKR